MSTYTIIAIIVLVIYFIYKSHKRFESGESQIRLAIAKKPDEVFSWTMSNPEKCFTVSSPYGTIGDYSEEYIGPFRFSVPTLDGDSIQLYIKKNTSKNLSMI